MLEKLDRPAPRLGLYVLVAAILLALVAGATASSTAFSVYNSDWDGTDALRSSAEEVGVGVTVADRTATYESHPSDGTVAFVLAPRSSYSARDVTRVREFVQTGGTLVVADDFGPHANGLLRALNASARLDGRLLRDPRSNYHASAMPVASGVANHSLTTDTESITLNYGTAVEPNDATTLVNTSDYAYLDADRSGNITGNETLDAYAVATVESVGEGRIVVVSDPSVFINAMLQRPGNRQFARALLSEHDRLVLDYSHAGSLPPAISALIEIRRSTSLQFGIGLLSVGLLAVWSRRPGIASEVLASVPRPWRTPSSEDVAVGATTAELVEYLERRHPDWSRQRIERVVAALERRRNR